MVYDDVIQLTIRMTFNDHRILNSTGPSQESYVFAKVRWGIYIIMKYVLILGVINPGPTTIIMSIL